MLIKCFNVFDANISSKFCDFCLLKQATRIILSKKLTFEQRETDPEKGQCLTLQTWKEEFWKHTILTTHIGGFAMV